VYFSQNKHKKSDETFYLNLKRNRLEWCTRRMRNQCLEYTRSFWGKKWLLRV